jgi:DNA polymerase III subunit epsilon
MFSEALARLFQRRERSIRSQSAPIASPVPTWLSHLPASVVFCDVETTGITLDDRIVSFAGIGLKTAPLANGTFELAYSHLIFDPGRRSHKKAERVHGYSDWVLRFQNPFSVYAEEISNFISAHDVFVAHNASFDLAFINRELEATGFSALARPIYCTMEGYKTLGGRAASLDAICEGMNLRRSSQLHGALEDAWLVMFVYLWLHGCPMRAPLPASVPLSPTNLVQAPPMLDGPIPRRKKHVAA